MEQHGLTQSSKKYTCWDEHDQVQFYLPQDKNTNCYLSGWSLAAKFCGECFAYNKGRRSESTVDIVWRPAERVTYLLRVVYVERKSLF